MRDAVDRPFPYTPHLTARQRKAARMRGAGSGLTRVAARLACAVCLQKDPRREARIELYRARAALGLPLFEPRTKGRRP